MGLQDFVSAIQSSKAIGYSLLTMGAILSALLTELLLGGSCFRNRGVKLLSHLVVCILLFLLEIGLAVGFFFWTMGAMPQEEGFLVLLKRIGKVYGTGFLIPLFASALASWLLHGAKENRKLAMALSGIFLVVLTFLNSAQFFLNSFRLVRRPHVPVPVEAVSFLINSRMNTYPFALSSDVLERIGDGSDLLTPPAVANAGGGLSGESAPPEEVAEPTDFRGYMDAVFAGSFAPGLDVHDYLRSAYDLFLEGRCTDDDVEYIGFMWHYAYIEGTYLPGYSEWDCLRNALEYYQKAEERFGSSAVRYDNMALIYHALEDIPHMRECLNLALELEPGTGGSHLSNYKEWAREWADEEPPARLMEDAGTILLHDPWDLSMIVLYSACALAENTNIENAYQLLCGADEHFQGGSTMVKILRCICADLMGRDESFLLSDIYALEKEKELSGPEEIYLVRYLFATNRNEDLWGYIAGVGKEEGEALNPEQALMKADWYFKTSGQESFSAGEAGELLAKVQEQLLLVEEDSREEELLLLARTMLQSSLGETEPVGEYEPKGLFYTEYALAAITAFNAGRYEEAGFYCENFFEEEETRGEAAFADGGSLLRPQEEVNLFYYVQLVYAYSHFEYAKEFRRNSEEWKTHMELAERECDAFEQSSKSLFYIGELFQTLKNSIAVENGTMPEEEEAAVGVLPGLEVPEE